MYDNIFACSQANITCPEYGNCFIQSNETYSLLYNNIYCPSKDGDCNIKCYGSLTCSWIDIYCYYGASETQQCLSDNIITGSTSYDFFSLSRTPTNYPTNYPTFVPSMPTLNPTKYPTLIPTIPTNKPTIIPTMLPSTIPTKLPSQVPTKVPSKIPSKVPTNVPSAIPIEIITAGSNYDYNSNIVVFDVFVVVCVTMLVM